mgnify:CR=1 FL=1|tara:strand:- start:4195 stop:4413 length:219 start_codon:yes stop_codon:yes gene_type:complete
MTPFAEFLIRRRKELGLSQKDVAKAVGLSQPTVLGWEKGHGKPRSVVLKNLFWVLKLSATESVYVVHLLGEG